MRAYGKGKDTYEAAQAVKEQLTATPEVKAVVYQPSRYSGLKTSPAQVDRIQRAPSRPGTTTRRKDYFG